MDNRKLVFIVVILLLLLLCFYNCKKDEVLTVTSHKIALPSQPQTTERPAYLGRPVIDAFAVVSPAIVDYTPLKYGALYNWYAATDVRGISSGGGWGVPSIVEFNLLLQIIEPNADANNNEAGKSLKELGFVYWDENGGLGNNVFEFNGRGAGNRLYGDGSFSLLKNILYLYTNSKTSDFVPIATLNSYNDIFNIGDVVNFKNGNSIRLFRPATLTEQLQADGTPCANYTGNDGKVYRTVKIGIHVWLADNLCETEFLTGEAIPIVTENSAWAGLRNAGMCYYNNDITNALE